MKYQKDLVAKNKNILVRVDLNVPIIKKKIIDNTKIVILKKTIKDLSKKNNKIFLISHLGRPKGKKVNKYSLKPLTRELEKMINEEDLLFLKEIYNLDASGNFKDEASGKFTGNNIFTLMIQLTKKVKLNESKKSIKL